MEDHTGSGSELQKEQLERLCSQEKRTSVARSGKRRIIKNVLIISVAWLLLFTSYNSLQSLQSSINRQEGLGTTGLAVVHVSMVLSCLLLPPTMIRYLGCKRTILVSMSGYIAYTLANIKPDWYTIIPASILIGTAAAPLWTVQATYLTEMGVLYARMSGESYEHVISRFFGIFFCFYQSNSVIGGIVSSNVLATDNRANNSIHNISNCGINYCHGSENNTNLKRPDDIKIYTLMGVFTGVAFAAWCLIFFVDDINMKHDENAPKFDPNALLATLTQMKNTYQLLLIPLTMFIGLQKGYFFSEFTKAFVSCTQGIWMVGYVTTCFGVSDALGSYLCGKLHAYIGRIPLFVLGASILSGCLLTMILWTPENRNNEILIMFVLAGLWGISDSVWQTQLNAFYGVVFSQNCEAAFANYRLWECAGYVLAFGCSNYLCVRVKTYIVWLALLLGLTCYAITDILIRKKKGREGQEKPSINGTRLNVVEEAAGDDVM